MFRRLDAHMLVSGQLRPDDMAAAKAQGVGMIVNNRPDGEAPGQPTGAEIEAAARRAGIDYRFIPVAGGLSHDQIEAMARALEDAEGQLLAYCTSGTRSTFLWALAEARRGAQGAALVAKAAEAGYDLSPIAHLLYRE
ncbi:protein tyrosine phosphatase family protein [Sphingosinicella rhizophila]|uniref:TIGR01244 family sulfur transferase n=1 Tax=Sphingosinicella rhizophila TaxID=3050082 RepID=A0ABU3Q8I3_9SPHN|nr:TIGR01244 family sulfur transferase [Sphingosinicella sp. GR2756]MDT9599612.1 TIGR01244 family sulfur transferase [Sphingosinicella sp. GR2756]